MTPALFAVDRSARSSRVGLGGLVVAVAVMATLPFIAYESVTSSLISLFVLVIIASMWNLLAGFGGLVSIGQQAFIGVGAYTVIYLSSLGVSPFVAVGAAAAVSGLLAVPTSLLAFRLRGDYFAIGMWVIAEVYRLLVTKIDAVGGASGKALDGMSGMDQAMRAAATYWTALAVMVVAIVSCYLLLRGRVGLSLTAVRDDEVAARAAGVNVVRAKRIMFLVSAAGCGAAGGVLVIDALSVQPGAIFSVQWSAYMIFIVVIGGIGYLEGPIVGAVIFFVMQQVLADSGAWYLIVVGTVAIVSGIVMPRGLWGELVDRTGFRLFPTSYFLRGAEE